MLLIPPKTKVYAFVGPSGTGKSYRAQMVANSRKIDYIIDDGLLIHGNEVLAGVSAKKASNKIATVRNALFQDEDKAYEVKKVIKKRHPESILILGTSDDMVKKIAENLELPEISETIYIQDVATEEEMKTAKRIRVTQGKHVIPVPTFAIKKDFSGYLLDPLQIFKSMGKGNAPYVSEKSMIRPTFSYMGNFEISDNVFKQIIDYIADETPEMYKVPRIIIKKHDEFNDGLFLYLEVTIEFGYPINEGLRKFKEKVIKEIEKLTAMNVLEMKVVVKDVHYKKQGEEE